MTNREYKILNEYLGSDSYAYVIIRRNKGLEYSDKRTDLYNEIKKIFLPGEVIYSNVNYMSPTSITLQNIANGTKSNSLIVKRDILIQVLRDQSGLDNCIDRRIVYVKDRKSINDQQYRKQSQVAKTKVDKQILDKNVKAILQDDKKRIPRKDWIKANEVVLSGKSTSYEKMVFKKLSKSLKNRVKAQVPFTINGNIYFTDICIKCKKIIIEVDGGYHNLQFRKNKDNQRDKDFQSIGYTTIRIKNEDVSNQAYLSKFINDIINTPNVRKSA